MDGLRKHPFTRSSLFARNIPSGEERGGTDVFAGYTVEYFAGKSSLFISLEEKNRFNAIFRSQISVFYFSYKVHYFQWSRVTRQRHVHQASPIFTPFQLVLREFEPPLFTFELEQHFQINRAWCHDLLWFNLFEDIKAPLLSSVIWKMALFFKTLLLLFCLAAGKNQATLLASTFPHWIQTMSMNNYKNEAKTCLNTLA